MKLKLLPRYYADRVFRKLPPPVRYQIRGRWQVPPPQCKRICSDLKHRLKSGLGPSIWFLPTLTWFCTSFQRPQQMARALSEIGCPVIYSEPWEFKAHSTSKEGVFEREFIGVRDIAPRLHLLRCPLYMLPDYLAKSRPDVLSMVWPHQAHFIPPDSSSFLIYSMIDDHSLIPNADAAWRKRHVEWVRKTDVMVATADELLSQLNSMRPDTLLLPNGVRLEDWNLKGPLPVPRDIAAARRAPVVVGYYGSIADWFDWEMWEYAAKTKPDWSFILIGPPYLGDLKNIDEHATRLPNMYYLGPKSYQELPMYLAQFDIATIPFIINKITDACSPIKLFEYMAAGKPVVTSPMKEIVKYKSVLTAADPEAFVNQLDNALLVKDDTGYRLVLKQEAEANTWRSRATLLRRTLETVRERQNNIPRRQNGNPKPSK